MTRPTVRDMIESLDLTDLHKMKADLEGGGRHLLALTGQRIKDLEATPTKVCATCGNELATYDESFTLVFGPPDFRKRASFCAHDCLDYFLDRLKGMKEVRE